MSIMEVYVNGKLVDTNQFVRNILHDVLLAILNNLHGVEIETIKKIEIS